MSQAENPFRQRLIVLFDGTWNDQADRTNVYRLATSLHGHDGAIRQRFFYDPGVGTGQWDRLRGGLTGFGLDRNLCQGYEWLCRRYAAGDEIFLFGFSRGAYTARSLAGMIRKCGLLKIVRPELLDEAISIYRNTTLAPDDCEAFRERHSWKDVRIEMIGVWDTVGALGVPGTVIFKDRYKWHDTELSRIVKRAYQALALDEHRATFESVPWTTKTGRKKPENIDVEQRWFIGAHANVGGGYPDHALSDIALEWLQCRALDAGLKLDVVKVAPDAFMKDPVDSLKEFFWGLYYLYRKVFHRDNARYYRPFDTNRKGERAVNVTVDDSVWKRWRADKEYRPPTLTDANCKPPDKQAVA